MSSLQSFLNSTPNEPCSARRGSSETIAEGRVSRNGASIKGGGTDSARGGLDTFLRTKTTTQPQGTARRCITKGSSATVASDLPTKQGRILCVRHDGTKVWRTRRMVKKTNNKTAPSKLDNPQVEKKNLAAFLDKSHDTAAAKSSRGSSATFPGTKFLPSRKLGEVYIREDGKKVRLVKKLRNQKQTRPAVDSSTLPKQAIPMTRQNPGEPTKSSFPTTPTTSSSTHTVSTSKATERADNTNFVEQTGDVLIKSMSEGDIVLRADGKRVLRRKKNAIIGKESNGLIYRRADGKLVRRVEKGSMLTCTAGDLACLLDGKNPKLADRTDDMVTVAGSFPVEASMKSRDTASTTSLPTKDNKCASTEEPPTHPIRSTLDIEYESSENIFKGRETTMTTLKDIAKASGQDPPELKNAIEQHNSSPQTRPRTRPRFLLNPACPKQNYDEMVEVVVPISVSAREKSPAPPGQCSPVSVCGGTNTENVLVDEGHEVVDSKLAEMARTLVSLGEPNVLCLLEQLQEGDTKSLLGKLARAEKYRKKLEKQIAQAGLAIAEDIDYEEAKRKVGEIVARMIEIGSSDVVHPDKEIQYKLREEYYKLEQEMEKYNTALTLTDEFQAEQERIEKQWEERNARDNLDALKKIRRHMPVNIRRLSEAELTGNPSPNGKFLPKPIAMKFMRTNVLQAIRLNPEDLERMHPSTLENLRVTGLTLTERRALYCHLQPLGHKWEKNKADKLTERKWTWFQMMKSNFKDALAPYQSHVDEFGPPCRHVGCPFLGKRCPVRADKSIDYDGDYGWPQGDEYEPSDTKKIDSSVEPGALGAHEALELARAKKARQRASLLKQHYKKKLLQIAAANESCESMDQSIDKMEFALESWIKLMLEQGSKMSEEDTKKQVIRFTKALNVLKVAILRASKGLVCKLQARQLLAGMNRTQGVPLKLLWPKNSGNAHRYISLSSVCEWKRWVYKMPEWRKLLISWRNCYAICMAGMRICWVNYSRSDMIVPES